MPPAAAPGASERHRVRAAAGPGFPPSTAEGRGTTLGDTVWKRAARGLVKRMGPFFPGDVLLEVDPRDRGIAADFRRAYSRSTPLVVAPLVAEPPAVRAALAALPFQKGSFYHVAVHLWDADGRRILPEVLRVAGHSAKVYVLLHGDEAVGAQREVVAALRKAGVGRVADQVLSRARGGARTTLLQGRLPWGEDAEDAGVDKEG